MKRSSRALTLIIALFLILSTSFADRKELTVRIWLFQGTFMEDQPGTKQVEIIPISTSPAFASVNALAGGSEADLKAAMINALLEANDLRKLTDLFLVKQTRREDLPFPRKFVLGRQVAYRIDLTHKVLSPERVAFRIVILKTKEGVVRAEKDDRVMLRNAWNATQDEEKMERIVGQDIVLGFGDPVVVSIPAREGAYFMVVKLTANEPEPERRTRRSTPTLKPPPAPILAPAPPPVRKVLPSYPNELRRRGIRGDVGLRIAIDEKGDVQMVQVTSPLHPYLDYAASRAFWQWKFEPVLRGGKPIRTAFDYTFAFDPATYALENADAEVVPPSGHETTRKELETILGGSAVYCRKLAEAALFYTCDETIKEINHFLKPPDQLTMLTQRRRDYTIPFSYNAIGEINGLVTPSPQIMDARNVQRIIYNCDYQMIRRYGDIEERRIILKKNGRKITDQVELLAEDRYAVLSPIVSSLKLMDEAHQLLFNFRIIKEERVSGKNAYVLEALPKFGEADGVQSAKVWINKTDFQILKCEIEGVPLDGYDDVLGDAVLLNVQPYFLRTYEFLIEKSGVMLPGRTTVKVEYPSIQPNSRETKTRIDLSYKSFKFFTVETDEKIKK